MTDRRRRRFDEAVVAGASFSFAFALGVLGIAIPLIAITVGYSALEVGLFVAVSGVSQFLARFGLGRLMRRIPDKLLVVFAGVAMAASCLLLAISTDPVMFVVTQLLQGASRAYFWTGLQTHAVRVAPRSVAAISRLNLASGIGSLIGPLVAGVLLHFSNSLTLQVTAAAAVVTAIAGAILIRLPPFAARDRNGAPMMWRRKEIRAGASMAVVAGGWSAVLNSFVPVALTLGGLSPIAVGALTTLAYVASLLGASAVGVLRDIHYGRALLLTGSVVAVGLVITGLMAHEPIAVGIGLSISGVASGAAQTIGIAAVSDSVHPDERGDAIAASGAYRAGALIFTPLAGSALVAALPVSAVIGVIGLMMLAPSVLGLQSRQRGGVEIPEGPYLPSGDATE